MSNSITNTLNANTSWFSYASQAPWTNGINSKPLGTQPEKHLSDALSLKILAQLRARLASIA